MSESRFLKLVVIGLLLLNAGTLGYLLLGGRGSGSAGAEKMGEHPMHRHGPGGPARFLRERLQLTDAQEDQYRSMRHAHHEEVVHIRSGIRAVQRRLYALMHDGTQPADNLAAAPLLDSMAAAQRSIDSVTFTHFQELRGICTPPQQQKFDEVIGEALEELR
jgi:Spy/CpxP family protein refolding chaperone